MDGPHKMDVAEWIDTPPPPVPRRSRPGYFLSPAVLGLIGTLVLHGTVIQSIHFALASAHLPEVRIVGTATHSGVGKPEESLVFVDLSAEGKVDNKLGDSIASVVAAVKSNPIKVSKVRLPPPPDLPILALTEENASDSSSGQGNDEAERAQLLGIYSGQIQARIERVWSRPRTPVNEGGPRADPQGVAEYFHCQVQIVQDLMGNVREILLPNCNGSVAWQRSLVLAIQQASPLPAPPSPTVYSPSVSLNFVGYRYTGGSDDGYETRRIETASIED